MTDTRTLWLLDNGKLQPLKRKEAASANALWLPALSWLAAR